MRAWPTGWAGYAAHNFTHRSAYFLADLYELTGERKYIDKAISIVEESRAWQGVRDVSDPYAGSGPDGSWYLWNSIPNPLPT